MAEKSSVHSHVLSSCVAVNNAAASNYSSIFLFDYDTLINAAKIVAKDENFRVSVKYSTASGAITGLAGIIGGLLLAPVGLGPVGFVFGAGAGSLTSFTLFKNKYISLVEVIDNLPDQERDVLIKLLQDNLKCIIASNTFDLPKLLKDKNDPVYKAVTIAVKLFQDHFEKL